MDVKLDSPRQYLHRRHRQPPHPPHRRRLRQHHHRRRHRHPGRGPDNVAATSALNYPAPSPSTPTTISTSSIGRTSSSARSPFRAISPGGIVDGASFSAPPAPGGIFSLFGANLSAATEAFSTVPLPTTLAGVSLEINGAAVPLYLVSPGQINAQLPFDTAPGPATAVIVTPAGRTTAATFTVVPAAPAIFLAVPAGNGVITAYVTGLGAVSPAVPTGSPAPLDVLSYATATRDRDPRRRPGAQSSSPDSRPASSASARSTSSIPNDAPKGDAVPLVLEINGQKSKPAPVAIR